MHGRCAAIVAVALLVAGCASGSPNSAATSSKPATPAPSSTPIDLQPFDGELSQLAASGQFSGAVLAGKDGDILMERGYGMADRSRGIANTPYTKFTIASLGKMFTAIAIAQLAEQGKLGFNDAIGKYVPGFAPDVANKVTIAQLLTHTSGLGDVALARTPNTHPATTLDGMMARIVEEPLQSAPGSQFSYSNDGFIVLGSVIEHVTGQSYGDYLREHIFKPAGMTDTDIKVYQASDVPNMAHGYALVDQDGQPLPPGPAGPGQQPSKQSGTLRDIGDMPQIGNPSGGAYSTVEDLLRFARALMEHTLLGPALTDTVLAGKVDANRPGGPPIDKYAYGFSDQTINGVRIVGHNGGTPGYEGQLDIYPDRGYVVVILANQDRVLVPAIQKSEALLTT